MLSAYCKNGKMKCYQRTVGMDRLKCYQHSVGKENRTVGMEKLKCYQRIRKQSRERKGKTADGPGN